MNQSPALAVFLKNMDMIRESLAKRVTLIFSTNMPGFELFSPSAMSSPKSDGVPGVQALMGGSPPAKRSSAEPTTTNSPATIAADAADPKTGG